MGGAEEKQLMVVPSAALGFSETPSSIRQFLISGRSEGTRLAGIRVGIFVVGWSVTHVKRRGGNVCGRGRGGRGRGGKVNGASEAVGKVKGVAGVRPCACWY